MTRQVEGRAEACCWWTTIISRGCRSQSIRRWQETHTASTNGSWLSAPRNTLRTSFSHTGTHFKQSRRLKIHTNQSSESHDEARANIYVDVHVQREQPLQTQAARRPRENEVKHTFIPPTTQTSTQLATGWLGLSPSMSDFSLAASFINRTNTCVLGVFFRSRFHFYHSR